MAHNEGNIRINGGEYFNYKIGAGSWTDFGIVAAGAEVDDQRAMAKIKIAGGYIVPVVQSREITLILELAETDKTHLDMVDSISGKTAQIYIYDGIVDTNNVAFYAPAALMTVSVKKKDGDTPQKITVTCLLKRQAALVSVADTGLPASGGEVPVPPAGTYTGLNKFYQWISWAVT